MKQLTRGRNRIHLTRGQRIATTIVAPLAVGALVLVGAGAASSADRSTPTASPKPPAEMMPPPPPISEQDAQRAGALGQAVTSSVQPTAEDVAEGLGITYDEAKELLERSERYADGLSPIQAGPGEGRERR